MDGSATLEKRRGDTPLLATSPGLPRDVLREASRRLGWASLLYSAAFFLAFFASHLIGTGTGVIPEGMEISVHPFQVTVAAVSIALGVLVFGVTRYADLRPELVLDLGLVFEVVAALGIATSEWWGVFPVWPEDPTTIYMGISWTCLWIVVFPMIAPSTPGKTLLASLAAASMAPAVFFTSKAAGLTSPEAPFGYFVLYFLFTTYLAAGMAWVVARWVHRWGTRLSRAREVGSYRLIERLGSGGMGEVWRAAHRMLARDAAVKIIRPELLTGTAGDPETLLRRFEREARATAALGSPHTIQLYDFGVTEDGAFYYVMELLDGVSLETLVDRYGPLPAGRAVHLLRQACHSLGEAHARGMVHRDIKPSNLFTCRLGPDHDFLKVLDFGLVKTPDGFGSGSTALTAEGLGAGTPAFIAPEIVLGRERPDGRADLYSLGCVAYWLLTARRVFEGDTPLSVIVDHVQTPPVPPSRRTELPVPDALERVVLSCLAKDPAERPGSAGDLDRLLAECGAAAWGTDEAREWWELHVPASDVGAGAGEVGRSGKAGGSGGAGTGTPALSPAGPR